MKRNQQGFTLIELMIVIAIIAILMAYAIPAYKDYTIRAKAGEGLTLAAGAKNAISEYYFAEGKLPTTNTEAGVAAANTIKGENVTSVAIGAAGAVTITYTANETELNTKTLVLVPAVAANAGSIQWDCSAGAGTLAAQYRPSGCRN